MAGAIFGDVAGRIFGDVAASFFVAGAAGSVPAEGFDACLMLRLDKMQCLRVKCVPLSRAAGAIFGDVGG